MTEKSTSGYAGNEDILDDRRIWVGNLDPRLSEYQLLKIMQKCGTIDKFDMLFHKGGPLIGQSRGYAFITFKTTESALNALEKLHGTSVANRPIAVRLAKNVTYDELTRKHARLEIPALSSGPSREATTFSRREAIRVIENKLQMLQRNNDDNLEVNAIGQPTGLGIPFIQRYNYNKDNVPNSSAQQRSMRSSHSRSSAPYNRNNQQRRRR